MSLAQIEGFDSQHVSKIYYQPLILNITHTIREVEFKELI